MSGLCSAHPGHSPGCRMCGPIIGTFREVRISDPVPPSEWPKDRADIMAVYRDKWIPVCDYNDMRDRLLSWWNGRYPGHDWEATVDKLFPPIEDLHPENVR